MTNTDTNTPQPPVSGLIDGSVFFGAEADELDENKTEEGATEVSPDVAKMQGQVDELSKQLESMRQTNLTLMMKPDAPKLFTAPAAPEALPDLMEDPDAYAKALERQITARVEARMTATQAKADAERSATSQYNDLWDDFKGAHKEYAGDSRKVQFAANQVVANLAKQGMDVEKYMFTYRQKFMADVVLEMDSIFGKPGEKTPVPGEELDPSRTGGMFGGADSGNKVEAPMAPDNAFADIRKWQEETGFHR